MNTLLVDNIANAVLYEGYMLYPYRRSVKNRKRWTFGCVQPQSPPMQTQCLLEADAESEIEAEVRFLHVLDRMVARVRDPSAPVDDLANLEFVEAFDSEGTVWESWQEAVERRVSLGPILLSQLMQRGPLRREFEFPAAIQVEPLLTGLGTLAGAVVRRQSSIAGLIELEAQAAAAGLLQVSLRIANGSPRQAPPSNAEEAVLQELVSTHTILSARDGQFVSFIDPPCQWQALTDSLQNQGAWPVLVGREGERNMVLSSPIILYDYPQVALQSPGDLFDATEIDEILSLRIMTLTDEEKRQACALDARAREMLERTDALSEEHLMRLHGAMRGMKPIMQTHYANPIA